MTTTSLESSSFEKNSSQSSTFTNQGYHDQNSNARYDHSYSLAHKTLPPSNESSESIGKGINSVKDLKKKHELLNKNTGQR